MIQLFKYQLPFNTPLYTSTHTFRQREGVIIVYTEDEITAYGEAAPLPGFSMESLQEVEAVLQFNRKQLDQALKENTAQEFSYALNQVHNFPSLAFAIDTVVYDLKAKRNRQPYLNKLATGNFYGLKTNALLSLNDKSQVLKAVEAFKAKGYTTVKLKVGINIDYELDCIELIRNRYPDITLRIDVNGAWSMDEAIMNLKALQHLNIEYCEQPLAVNDRKGLAKVREETEILLAADESVRNKTDAFELIKTEAVDVLVIKPSLFGGIENIIVTKELADSHNIDLVFTTTMESAVARASIANIAAAIGSKNRVHGLGTGSLFSYDVADCSWLNKSIIDFPQVPGLGLTLDITKLKEI